VVRDEDGRVADDAHAAPVRVLLQRRPLAEEAPLAELPEGDARRVPGAIEALFRTDVDLKSSGGDPRVLLERLVIELCGVPRPAARRA